jgi:hypothetical protein
MDIVRLTVSLLLCNAFVLPALVQSDLPDHRQPQQSLPDPSAVVRSPGDSVATFGTRARAPQGVDNPWPREATRGDEKISMYQPQLETWRR